MLTTIMKAEEEKNVGFIATQLVNQKEVLQLQTHAGHEYLTKLWP
jgi:hypothetical protein